MEKQKLLIQKKEAIELYKVEDMQVIFQLLRNCEGVVQVPEYHPEGDVLNHSLQSIQIAFRETNDIDLILAALLHDIGKAVESHGHEQIGCEMLEGFASEKTLFLIKHHMRIWTYINGEMKKLSSCTFLAQHCWLPELVQLARFDKRARKIKQMTLDEGEIVQRLNTVIEHHFTRPLSFEEAL